MSGWVVEIHPNERVSVQLARRQVWAVTFNDLEAAVEGAGERCALRDHQRGLEHVHGRHQVTQAVAADYLRAFAGSCSGSDGGTQRDVRHRVRIKDMDRATVGFKPKTCFIVTEWDTERETQS